MINWLGILQWMTAIGMAVIYYKSSTQKLRNAYGFYRIVTGDYKLTNKKKASVLSPFLASIELITALWLVVPWMQVFGFMMVACLQILFLFVLIPRKGLVLKNGCGCFGLNTPKEITSRDLVNNSAILSVVLIFIGINLLGV